MKKLTYSVCTVDENKSSKSNFLVRWSLLKSFFDFPDIYRLPYGELPYSSDYF